MLKVHALKYFLFALVASVYIPVSFWVKAEAPVLSGAQKTVALFDKYYLNAPWIIDECMDLTIDQFAAVWQELVNVLTTAKQRWFYFCDKPQEFDQTEYWQQCLWQCKTYHEWLTTLYIDAYTTKLLTYKPGEQIPADVLSILDYWTLTGDTSKEPRPDQQFYAFYIDCITHVYKECVEGAHAYKSDIEQYKSYISCGLVSLDVLDKLLERIKDTPWYERYFLDSKKLREIMSELGQEFILSEAFS